MLRNYFFNNFKKIKHSLYVKKIYYNYFIKEKIKVIYTHKNNTFLVFLKKRKIYRKFSFTKNGIKKIHSAYIGLRWYCLSQNLEISKIVYNYKKTKTISFLDTKTIDGKQIKSWNNLSNNYKYIIKVLDHYKKIFKKDKIHKIHGDLTLDNIFFRKKSVFIIDWEFFSSKKNKWGYDAVYLVLSSIVLPYIANNSFTTKDKICFIKLWKILIKMKIDKNLMLEPFLYFKKNIKTDKFLRESLSISKEKFFPFLVTAKLHKEIINLTRQLK